MQTRVIPTSTHGRYLLREPTQPGAAVPLLVGFHGYMETAETQMDRLTSIPGNGNWLLVAIQGLNRFYRSRTDAVVANWMTRQDRDLAIADNQAYVSAVLGLVAKEWDVTGPLVFAGFSQGVAMALRAACSAPRRVEGVVVLGGDVPPELDGQALSRTRRVLLGRGERDEWYTAEKRSMDITRLHEAGVELDAPLFDTGHEWTEAFSFAAGRFLDRQLASVAPTSPAPREPRRPS